MVLKLTAAYEPGEFLRLFERIRRTTNRVIAIKQSLVAEYPMWASGSDARLGLFRRLHNQLNPAMFAVHAMDRHIADPDWWQPLLGRSLDVDGMNIELLNLSQFLKIGLLHQVFSTIEGSYRTLLRALDPRACAGATAEFKSVYDCLLGSKLNLAPDDCAVIDLLRHLRNTVHNGGVVFHRKGLDQQVQYRGVHYDFQHEGIVQFAAWEPLLTWIDDAVILSEQVVRHAAITALSAPLEDRSATVL